MVGIPSVSVFCTLITLRQKCRGRSVRGTKSNGCLFHPPDAATCFIPRMRLPVSSPGCGCLFYPLDEIRPGDKKRRFPFAGERNVPNRPLFFAPPGAAGDGRGARADLLASYRGYYNLAGRWGKIGILTSHNAVSKEIASLLQWSTPGRDSGCHTDKTQQNREDRTQDRRKRGLWRLAMQR